MSKEIRKCDTCESNYKHEPLIILNRDLAADLMTCPRCQEKEEEALRKFKLEQNAQRNWQKEVPYEYRRTEIDHPDFKKNYAHFIEAVKWLRRPSKRCFLGIVGESGKCKTRIAAELARKVIWDGDAVRWVNSSNWQWDVQHLHCNEEQVATTARVMGAKHARVLFFDDLGSLKATEAVCEQLYGLLEHRSTKPLMMVWTSNEGVEEMLRGKNISDKARVRCLSRLAGYSDIITV